MSALAVAVRRAHVPSLAHGEPPGWVLGSVAVSIAAIPLVAPRGPGNTGPVDLIMLGAALAVALWVSGEARPFTMPYAAGVLVLMWAGALSGLLEGRGGPTLLVIVQEIHLFLFCATIATVARTPRALEAIRAAWTAGAFGWGVLLIASVTLGIDALVSADVEEGTRARLFFVSPNITGNFFMVSFFVAASSTWPRQASLRAGACGVLLVATFLTGSNAAILGVVLGSGLGIAWWLWHRAGPAAALAFAGLSLAIGSFAFGIAHRADVVAKAEESEQALIRYSIGRFGRSADARQDLFASQIELYRQSGFLGIGPSATRDKLGEGGESGVRSAHNDYLATLVERGPVGFIGLTLLILTAGARVARSTPRRIRPELAGVVGTGAGAAGAALAIAFSATTHEVLHYRQTWALLGIVAAVHAWATVKAPPDWARATRAAVPPSPTRGSAS